MMCKYYLLLLQYVESGPLYSHSIFCRNNIIIVFVLHNKR